MITAVKFERRIQRRVQLQPSQSAAATLISSQSVTVLESEGRCTEGFWEMCLKWSEVLVFLDNNTRMDRQGREREQPRSSSRRGRPQSMIMVWIGQTNVVYRQRMKTKTIQLCIISKKMCMEENKMSRVFQ